MSNPAASLGSEVGAVLATIDPDAYTASTYLTDEIDMKLWGQVMFVVMVGTMASSSTVDFAVDSADASGGSFDNEVAAITKLTEAGSDSDKQVIVNVKASDLPSGDRFIKGDLTVAAAASDCAVVAIGLDPRDSPASDNDLASVDEIVNS